MAVQKAARAKINARRADREVVWFRADFIQVCGDCADLCRKVK